jgi:site-specific DNA recombinase
VLHARVSTEEQRKNGYSLEEMVRVLREYAAQLGATIVEEIASDFANEGPDRGDVERLLELAHSGEIDAVMFFNVGRATRGGPGEYWMLTETLKKAGVGIYFAEERRKVGDSPEDEFLYGMKAVWAQVEKHEIKQRTMRRWTWQNELWLPTDWRKEEPYHRGASRRCPNCARDL